MIERGAIHWADFGDVDGSRPAKRRPAVVVQADEFNESALRTVVVAAITSNTELADLPGNVFLPAEISGLTRDSVVNVSAITALHRRELDPPVGRLPFYVFHKVEAGLRLVLGL